MTGLSHAGIPSLPPIAVAMAGLDLAAAGLTDLAPGGDRVRGVLAWLAKAGARGVRIDATMPGVRPRELDRSGRRDVGALLRRSELSFGGVDLFIPPEHFLKPETADRAVSSVLAAVELASDLVGLAAGAIVTRLASGSPTSVSLVLPAKLLPDIRAALADHATSRGVRLADQAWPIVESGGEASDAIAVGLDPATALASGADPIVVAAKLGRRLACARLSDIAGGAVIGGGRVAPGTGRLDVMAYLVTLATIGYEGHVVLDVHGLRDPASAFRDAAER
jgi:sugar phosphate isomerase/epimerase